MRCLSLLGIALCLAGLAACAQESTPDVDLYAALESQRGEPLVARVFLVGPDGNAITGSIVQIATPASTVALMPFDYSGGCYRVQISTVYSGAYTINCRGNPYGVKTLSLNHQGLQTTPAVSTCADALGNSALSGQTLLKSQSIALAWSAVSGATAYQVQVSMAGSSVYSTSTAQTSLLIPAASIGSAGTCSLSITAQYLSGDAVFSSAAYYSASSSRSSTLYFSVE